MVTKNSLDPEVLDELMKEAIERANAARGQPNEEDLLRSIKVEFQEKFRSLHGRAEPTAAEDSRRQFRSSPWRRFLKALHLA